MESTINKQGAIKQQQQQPHDVDKTQLGGSAATMTSRDNPNRGSLLAFLSADKIRELIQQGAVAKLNENDPKCRTALTFSLLGGHNDLVEALLKMDGIKVGKDGKGVSPLIVAALQGHAEFVTEILKIKDIHVNEKTNDRFRNTALMVAAEKGRTQIVQALLAAKGIDVNAKNTDGETALIKAAARNHHEIVALLCAVPGLNVNEANKKGNTALIKAAWQGHARVAAALLQVPRCQVNAANAHGLTALMCAAGEGHLELAVQLLNVPGINANAQNCWGATALIWTAMYGSPGIVRELLQRPELQVDVNRQDGNGETALIRAAEAGRSDIIAELLQADAMDVNVSDKQNDTALSKAVKKGHQEIIAQLLQVPDIDVDAALVAAAKQGNYQIMAELLKVKGHGTTVVNEEKPDTTTDVVPPPTRVASPSPPPPAEPDNSPKEEEEEEEGVSGEDFARLMTTNAELANKIDELQLLLSQDTTAATAPATENSDTKNEMTPTAFAVLDSKIDMIESLLVQKTKQKKPRFHRIKSLLGNKRNDDMVHETADRTDTVSPQDSTVDEQDSTKMPDEASVHTPPAQNPNNNSPHPPDDVVTRDDVATLMSKNDELANKLDELQLLVAQKNETAVATPTTPVTLESTSPPSTPPRAGNSAETTKEEEGLSRTAFTVLDSKMDIIESLLVQKKTSVFSRRKRFFGRG